MTPFDPGGDEWLLNGTKIIQRNVCLYWCQGMRFCSADDCSRYYYTGGCDKRPVIAS